MHNNQKIKMSKRIRGRVRKCNWLTYESNVTNIHKHTHTQTHTHIHKLKRKQESNLTSQFTNTHIYTNQKEEIE